MKAIAWPAAASTQPVLMAVTMTAVPTAADIAAAASLLRRTVARAPSKARSSTHTVPVSLASTATTVSTAPADRIITGAATDKAMGTVDSRLASDGDCARVAVQAHA